MLSIKLSRVGKKKQPLYRLIVTEKTRDPWGKSLEILGNYDPRHEPRLSNLKTERITHWLKIGAQPTDTVNNLLVDAGLLKVEKIKKGGGSQKCRRVSHCAPGRQTRRRRASETRIGNPIINQKRSESERFSMLPTPT